MYLKMKHNFHNIITSNNTQSLSLSISAQGYTQNIKSDGGKNLLWTDDINVELPIILQPNGPASKKPQTLCEVFIAHVLQYKEDIALQVERNNFWEQYTFMQFYEAIINFAKGLLFLGVKERAGVNIIGFNSPEWVIAYIGTIFANNISSGVYSTNNSESVLYIADHSDAEVIIMDTMKQYQKYFINIHKLNSIKAFVVYNDQIPPSAQQANPRLISWKEFMRLGGPSSIKDYLPIIKERIKKQRPGNCCTLFYTSGTVSFPKGVMLSHDNILYGMEEIYKCLKDEIGRKKRERIVSYLPLSHVAAFVCDVVTNFTVGSTLTFARPDALKGSLIKTMKQIRPTIFFAVPRVWEKIEVQIRAVTEKKVTKIISQWAQKLGYEGTMNELKRAPTPFGYSAAYYLFLNRIKKSLGLDKAEFIIFGSAPLQKSTLNFFVSLNIKLMNLYGLTETTGPLTVNLPLRAKLGTAGQTIPGLEVKIDPTTNEILGRGRTMFMGYYKNSEETKKVFTEDGYFKTGDIGMVDSEGFLTVTGRMKEIIITAGGENIPPLLIETTFSQICKISSQIVVIGDQRKFLSALITLKLQPDAEGNWTNNLSNETIEFVQNLGSQAKTIEEARKCPIIRKYIEKCINKLNSKAISRAQQIRKWIILSNDFSIDGGELTSTMKMKRNFVNQKYKSLIDSIYMEAKL